MTGPTVISIDAMGGDIGPSAVVPGVARAAANLGPGKVRFLLHGDSAQIEPLLKRSPG